MRIEALREVSADEAATLNLPRKPHGLVLITEHGTRWTLATQRLEFFQLLLEAPSAGDLRKLVAFAHEFLRRLPGWPDQWATTIGTQPLGTSNPRCGNERK